MDNLLDRFNALEERCERAERTAQRQLRRAQCQSAAAGLAVVASLLLTPGNRAALAQAGGNLVDRVAALEAKTQFMSVSGGETFFTGTNVHIRNGMGATATINALGNLILGYNEVKPFGTTERTGSHCLVAGAEHTYTSYGGIVVGFRNTIVAPYASVSGGKESVASGEAASVSGGRLNTAGGAGASVTGGQQNTASGQDASVSGGLSNTASGIFASVSGGANRSAPGASNWAAGTFFSAN